MRDQKIEKIDLRKVPVPFCSGMKRKIDSGDVFQTADGRKEEAHIMISEK
ncbi:hypothetical protein [Allobaculum mucilyticum]|nr:hypothetical protein [Allobaculum mucilyticum]UNT97088.1 hypothetical protein KWG62_04880 [Allobaculum mucilyticum]